MICLLMSYELPVCTSVVTTVQEFTEQDNMVYNILSCL